MKQDVYVEEGQSLATFEIYKQVLFDEKQAFIVLLNSQNIIKFQSIQFNKSNKYNIFSDSLILLKII